MKTNGKDYVVVEKIVIESLVAHLNSVLKNIAQKPSVVIEKSITPDYLICLEDGKQLKMLKRHLKRFYNMSPEEYKAKWGLPADYPMVAPNYANQRSEIAKQFGLGKTTKKGKKAEMISKD